MAPVSIVEHRLPGRARLRIPSKRGDVAWFASAVRQLARHPEIDELSANPRTGSLFIRHQASVDLLKLLATESSLIEIASSPERVRPSPVETEALAPTPEFLDMTSVSLLGLAAYQAFRGRVAGTALEHFWSAYGSAWILRNPTLAAGFAGLGLYQLMRGQLIGPAASLFYYSLTARYFTRGGGRDGPSQDTHPHYP
jgi:hypothetical protein